MKIARNDLEANYSTWDDPGDYPCGAGGSRLSSYGYVEEVLGDVVVVLSPEDLVDEDGKKYDEDNLVDGIRTFLEDEVHLDHVTHIEWSIEIHGTKAMCEVEKFQSDSLPIRGGCVCLDDAYGD